MPTRDKVLCWTYGLLAAGALIATWSQNIRFFRQEDNGGIVGFIEDGFANPAAASLGWDLGFIALAAAVWMVVEARRLGIRHVWVYLVLSLLIAVSVMFPLFLLVRQRKLAGPETAGDRAPGASTLEV